MSLRMDQEYRIKQTEMMSFEKIQGEVASLR